MLAEVRQAMLLSRLAAGVQGASRSSEAAPPLMTARQALEICTRGGAAVLGRSDVGSLESNKCADFFAINLNRLDFAGALQDPLAAIIFCHPMQADYTYVGGKAVVSDSHLTTVEIGRLVEDHNHAASRLIAG